MATGTVQAIGTVVKQNWKATSTSAYGTVLTETLTIPSAGEWLVILKLPIASASLLIQPSVTGVDFHGVTSYVQLESYGQGSFLCKCDAGATIKFISAASTSVTYSYIDRGSILAVKLA